MQFNGVVDNINKLQQQDIKKQDFNFAEWEHPRFQQDHQTNSVPCCYNKRVQSECISP